jgi:uncharacterized protein YjbI with pentapeptide repeats
LGVKERDYGVNEIKEASFNNGDFERANLREANFEGANLSRNHFLSFGKFSKMKTLHNVKLNDNILKSLKKKRLNLFE